MTDLDTRSSELLAPRWLVSLIGLIAALVVVASAGGIFLRGDLATKAFTTVRGDTIDMLLGGVYRFNGKAFAAEGVGWDAVTLFLVIPALLLTLPLLRRGSLRARLFTAGILAYFVYQYFEYAMSLAYGPFFLVYVAIGGLSLASLAVIAGGIDVANLQERVTDGFPHRAVIAFCAFVVVLLAGMWLPLIARTFGASQVAELNGGTTLVVQAFDLGFLVPLAVLTAIAVHRRLAAGYVLGPIVVVKGTAMAAGIASMMVVESVTTGVSQLAPIVVFSAIAVVSCVLGIRVFREIEPGRARTPSGARPARHATARGTVAAGGTATPGGTVSPAGGSRAR